MSIEDGNENEGSQADYTSWQAPGTAPAEKSEKQKRWEALSSEVEHIADGQSHGVDTGIKESVTAIMAHDFPTDQSCEGHLEGKHGEPYPWVQIYAPEPEGWQEDEAKQEQWTRENVKEQQRMMGLLAEFYQNRETPFDARIIFDKMGFYGAFRIQSMGADTMQLLPKENLGERSQLYQKEMQDFTQFLKDKYFSE